MTFRKFFESFRWSAVVWLSISAVCPALHAQAVLAWKVPDLAAPLVEASTPMVTTPSIASHQHSFDEQKFDQHKFWDKRNCALLLAAAVSNGADFAVTRANLQSGGQELNPVVRIFGRSSPGLAVNFVGETVGVVSLSYFFHKIGHHKLERAVSMLDIGSSAGAVSYGLMHR